MLTEVSVGRWLSGTSSCTRQTQRERELDTGTQPQRERIRLRQTVTAAAESVLRVGGGGDRVRRWQPMVYDES